MKTTGLDSGPRLEGAPRPGWVRVEAVAWLLGAAALGLAIQPILTGVKLPDHDNTAWGSTVFHYFAESLARNELPLWNPFPHGGEPFYPLLGQFRYYDPVVLAATWALTHFTTANAFVAFSWVRYAQLLFVALGFYLFARRYLVLLESRIFLVVPLFLSSFLLANLQQDGFLSQFLWAPYVMLAMDRIREKGGGWADWLLLALGFGMSWQSYFFSGPWTLLLFFVFGIALTDRMVLRRVFSRSTAPRIAVLALVQLPMMAPLAHLALDEGRFFFPARSYPKDAYASGNYGAPYPFECGLECRGPSIKINYEKVRQSGSHTTLRDYAGLFSPGANPETTTSRYFALGRTESVVFLGLIPASLAALGFFVAKIPGLGAWRIVLALFVLLTLGADSPFHSLLFRYFPPIQFVRNASGFLMYPTALLVLFAAVGLEWLATAYRRFARGDVASPLAIGWKARLVASGVLAWVFWVYCQTGRKIQLASYFGWTGLALLAGASALFFARGRVARVGAAAFLTLAAVFDLSMHIRMNQGLFTKEGTPNSLGWWSGRIERILPFETRVAYPVFGMRHEVDFPAVRYPENPTHQISALSPPHRWPQPYPPLGFEEILGAQRRATMFLASDYHRLVHFGIGADSIRASLAVGAPRLEEFASFSVIPWTGTPEKAAKLPAEPLLLETPEAMKSKRNPIERLLATAGDWIDAAPAPLVGGARSGAARAAMFRERHEVERELIVIENRASLLRVLTSGGRERALVFADAFDRDWVARIDSRAATLYRARGFSKAVIVSPGEHIVDFSYEPNSFLLSLLFFYGAALALVAALALAHLARLARSP